MPMRCAFAKKYGGGKGLQRERYSSLSSGKSVRAQSNPLVLGMAQHFFTLGTCPKRPRVFRVCGTSACVSVIVELLLETYIVCESFVLVVLSSMALAHGSRLPFGQRAERPRVKCKAEFGKAVTKEVDRKECLGTAGMSVTRLQTRVDTE